MSERLSVLYNKKPCYDIVFSQGFEELWQELAMLGCENKRLCIITDSKVNEIYGDTVLTLLGEKGQKTVKYVFQEGEERKNLDTVKGIYRFLIEEGFDRKDMLLALGGGVVGDIAGYVAATYLRGIDFVQIPSTLLAQADSSIGGKTGVDFDGYKNMVGAFKMPRLVYMNLSLLQTLEERQYFSGFAEIMKHGLIKDALFYEWLIDAQLYDKEAGSGKRSYGAGRACPSQFWTYGWSCDREGKEFYIVPRRMCGFGCCSGSLYFLETRAAFHGGILRGSGYVCSLLSSCFCG